MLTRRQIFINGSALTAAGLVVACTTSGGNTVTIDTAKIVTYGQAVYQALTAAVAAPAIASALGANLTVAQAVLAKALAGVNAVQAAAPSGTLSASVDTSTIQSTVTSIVNDAEQVATFVQSVLGAVTDPKTVATVGNWVSAVETLLPLIELAAGLMGAKRRSTTMSEATALAICQAAH